MERLVQHVPHDEAGLATDAGAPRLSRAFDGFFQEFVWFAVEGAGITIETWPGAWGGSCDGVTGRRSVWLRSVSLAASSSNSNSGPPDPIVIKA